MMNRVKIYVSETAFNQQSIIIESESKKLNKFLGTLTELSPELNLNKENVMSFVVGNKPDIQQIADLIMDAKLKANPQIAALKLSRSKASLILEIPDCSKLETYISINTLIQNGTYWKIRNNRVEFNPKWKEQLKESFTLYAESELELKRLQICTSIKKLSIELFNTIPEDERKAWDWESSCLYFDGEAPQVEHEYIMSGHRYIAQPRFFAERKSIPGPNDGKEIYQAALNQAANAIANKQ